MAATINVVCPKCKKNFQAPEAVKGKKVKCKGCQEVFTVAPKEEEEWAGAIKSYAVGTVKDKPRCPFCTHDLDDDEQIICLNCGYNLMTRERHHTKVLHEQTGGDKFMWLLPGILCLFLSLMFIGGIVLLWLPESALDFGEVWRDWVQRGEFNRVYGSVFCAFIAFYSGRFAVRRLILNPNPPEKEKHGTEEGND